MPADVSRLVTLPFRSPSSEERTMSSGVSEEHRIEVMSIIFLASLFAASFPTLSKQISILRIPKVVFFIGKHFGTGVILATAFTHLLDDAFRSLQNPLVMARYGNIGKWTGLIILGSLLVIFLVEYVSTSYVDYLQSKPSAPPTPVASVQPSRPASLKPQSRSSSYENVSHSTISRQPQQTISTNAELATTLNAGLVLPTETTPLLPSTDASFSPRELRHHVSAPTIYRTTKSLHSRDHSPHRYNHPHVHSIYTPIVTPPTVTGVPIDVLTNSPRIFRQWGMSHPYSREHEGHEQANEEDYLDRHHHDEHERLRVQRRRQVVGLLVLQLGIMIHSLVIGLTLAVTNGSDFASLTTAILFHQLFEGLSLGIRIASLPPKDVESHAAVGDEENLRSTQLPDPGAPSNSTLPSRSTEFSARAIGGGIQSQDSDVRTLRERGVRWLKPTLSILFAVTTPFGMCVGMILWKDGSDSTQMSLIQGTMSSISAGMLIYAGTVEMIAGDFVFGDVEGGHGHGHGHLPDSDPDQRSDGNSHSGSHLDNDDRKQLQEQLNGKATMMKKALAVFSLFAGVAGMVFIG